MQPSDVKVKHQTDDDRRNPIITPEKTTKRGKKKADTGKLSLYPLSIEDALRAAALTGRVTLANPKRSNRERKKPGDNP
jgi:hypothetical protein